jgi:hypothetical protein
MRDGSRKEAAYPFKKEKMDSSDNSVAMLQ